MKKTDLHRLTICRLLTLLLIVLVAVGSVAKQVNGAGFGANHHPLQNVTVNLWDYIKEQRVHSRITNNNTVQFSTQIRIHYLYNPCSKHLVKVKGKGRKGINAKGKMKGNNMAFSKLVFSPTPQGTIAIFGQHTAKAICFNDNGRLIGRDFSRAQHMELCEFVEEDSTDKNYTHYRSAVKPSWYIGFKKNGKALSGTSIHNNAEDCFRFLKINDPRQCKSENGIGPANVIFCNVNFVNKIGLHSLRHHKQHKGHRKR